MSIRFSHRLLDFRAVSLTFLIMLVPLAAGAEGLEGQVGYTCAISDLEAARAVVTMANPDKPLAAQSTALKEIDRAIQDLAQAAIIQGKDPSSVKQLYPDLDPADQISESIDLLNKAHISLNRNEPDSKLAVFQQDALEHLDRAIGALNQSTSI